MKIPRIDVTVHSNKENIQRSQQKHSNTVIDIVYQTSLFWKSYAKGAKQFH